MEVCGPELLILLCAAALRVIADAGDIVGQGIQPHIHHMPRVEVHGNPPFEGSPGHAEILEPRQEEIVHHLVLAGHGLDELRMLVDMLYQPVRVFAHTEEVGLLPGGLHLPAAVRAFALHQLGFRPEGFAGGAVHALVGPLVDISLGIHALEDLLHLSLMVIVRGADEFVIGNIQHIAHALDDAGHLVHELLWGDPGLLGLQLYLLSVLVRAGLEEDVTAFLPLEAGDAVRQHDLIVVAYMRLA